AKDRDEDREIVRQLRVEDGSPHRSAADQDRRGPDARICAETQNPLTNRRVSRERATGVEPATLCLARIRVPGRNSTQSRWPPTEITQSHPLARTWNQGEFRLSPLFGGGCRVHFRRLLFASSHKLLGARTHDLTYTRRDRF